MCIGEVSLVFQEVSEKFQGRFKSVSRVFQDSFKEEGDISGFQGYLKEL